ncbi:TerB family tellurite resistance protein [Methylibium petroleiphilum]|uniref:TerB family tellurite resistance protein n=1 Tax=Methylibium petroleiphilum TaxID=105560 RepID=UPI001ACC0B8C|nr:TerB family tellurite resistance protein [Methylibium petroleiphilum]MBN9203705.1 TerB family tellurite resistance protein [Methylibium petroleiphilum]
MNAPDPQLRPYPRNSAEAAARIVALALTANGRIKAVETAALDALQAPERLGLNRAQWHGVIHDLCADLLGPARCGDEGCIPSELLDHMLDEVDDDTLRRLVLRLCSAVVHADRQIDDGESFVLLGAIERWGLHPDDQALLEPMLYGTDFQVRPRGAAGDAAHKLRLR